MKQQEMSRNMYTCGAAALQQWSQEVGSSCGFFVGRGKREGAACVSYDTTAYKAIDSVKISAEQVTFTGGMPNIDETANFAFLLTL